MSEPITHRYKPRDDAYITGVPRRDLTAADLTHIAPWDLRNAEVSGLYEPVADEPPADVTSDPVADEPPVNRRGNR